jgi:hypothetical protein
MSTDARDSEARDEGAQQRARAGISEEQARELVERLRTAPASEVLTDLFSTLLSTAQVKLGRHDARLFIDLCALMSEHAGPYLSDETNKMVETALGQLRLGQVGAEDAVAKKGEAEPNDLSRVPTPPTTSGRTPAGSTDPSAPASSKLWVPGG